MEKDHNGDNKNYNMGGLKHENGSARKRLH